MTFPPFTALAPSMPARRWVAALGLLLGMPGAVLLGAGLSDVIAPPVRPVMATDRSAVSPAPPFAVASAPPFEAVGTRTGSRSRPGAEPDVAVANVQSTASDDCPGADLATGQRAESKHLAKVRAQRPADCGDDRVAILSLAALLRSGRDLAISPAPGAYAGTVLAGVDGVDVAAATLYGPPDRQPRATQEALLEESGPDDGSGHARHYLEETAASRLPISWRD